MKLEDILTLIKAVSDSDLTEVYRVEGGKRGVGKLRTPASFPTENIVSSAAAAINEGGVPNNVYLFGEGGSL